MGDFFVRTVRLLTMDSETIVVPYRIARVSCTVRIMLDIARNQQQTGCPIVLERVKAAALRKIIEWIEHHIDTPLLSTKIREKQSLTQWDVEFFKLDLELLNDMLIAASYLDIPLLLCMLCDVHAKLKRKKIPTSLYEVFRLAYYMEIDIMKARNPDYKVDMEDLEEMSDLDLPPEPSPHVETAVESQTSGNDQSGEKKEVYTKKRTIVDPETDSVSETDLEVEMINCSLIVEKQENDSDEDGPNECNA